MKRDVGELHLHYGNLKLYYGVIKAVNDDQKETPDEMKFNMALHQQPVYEIIKKLRM